MGSTNMSKLSWSSLFPPEMSANRLKSNPEYPACTEMDPCRILKRLSWQHEKTCPLQVNTIQTAKFSVVKTVVII